MKCVADGWYFAISYYDLFDRGQYTILKNVFILSCWERKFRLIQKIGTILN